MVNAIQKADLNEKLQGCIKVSEDKKFADGKVIVFHYAIKKPIPGYAVENNKKGISIELSLKNLEAYINTGDPVVIVYKKESNDYWLKGCHVTGVLGNMGVVEVEMDEELKGADARLYERLPVSIYADIKDDKNKRRYGGVLKDISKNGLLLYCKELIPVHSHAELNITLENAIIFLKTYVVRMAEYPDRNCYGLCIPSGDAMSMNNLYKCFKRTCEDYVKKLMGEYNILINFDRFEYPNIHVEEEAEQLLSKSAMKLETILKRSKY